MTNKIHESKTIEEAIDDLLIFLESNMWHSFEEEFKDEEDMIKYLRGHFDILEKQIKELKK